MEILQFRGKSLQSKAIRFQTRSVHSHTAILLKNGMMVEAWYPGGVRAAPIDQHTHVPGTKVDVYSILTSYDEAVAEQFLMSQVGKGYDLLSVLRFVTRRDAPANDRWFCSELALTACDRAGARLLVGNYAHMSPRDVSLSPLLNWTGELILP